MQPTKNAPLTDAEIDWLNKAMMIQCSVSLKWMASDGDRLRSESDFPEYLVQGPLGAGGPPHSLDQMTRFVGLCFQHLNDIARCLYEAPDQFQPIFNPCEVKGKVHTIVEE